MIRETVRALSFESKVLIMREWRESEKCFKKRLGVIFFLGCMFFLCAVPLEAGASGYSLKGTYRFKRYGWSIVIKNMFSMVRDDTTLHGMIHLVMKKKEHDGLSFFMSLLKVDKNRVYDGELFWCYDIQSKIYMKGKKFLWQDDIIEIQNVDFQKGDMRIHAQKAYIHLKKNIIYLLSVKGYLAKEGVFIRSEGPIVLDRDSQLLTIQGKTLVEWEEKKLWTDKVYALVDSEGICRYATMYNVYYLFQRQALELERCDYYPYLEGSQEICRDHLFQY